MTPQEAVHLVCECAAKHLSPERIRQSKERHAALFRWEDADYLPLHFGVAVPALRDLPHYDWTEQFYEPAKSFVSQMSGVVQQLAGGADYVPSIRADMGVVNGPSLFGVEFVVPAHTKTVVSRYAPKADLAAFQLPGDIRALGTMPRVIEHTQAHQATLREHGLDKLITVHHCDIQGPFDIAEQARGHDLLTDFYEDPAFVHHMMEQATRAYIAMGLLCKELAGEGRTWGNANGYWMNPGGVRMCDDSGILLSPGLFAEFVQPYQIRAFEAFGGGWLHYCGGVPDGNRQEGLHLHEHYLANPYLRGMNFTTGKDLLAEIRTIIAHRVNYIGGFRRLPGEGVEPYFRRLCGLCPGRKGMIVGANLQPEEKPGAIDLWHRVQDELI